MIRQLCFLLLSWFMVGIATAQFQPILREIPVEIDIVRNLTFAEYGQYTLPLDFYQLNHSTFQFTPERRLQLDLYRPSQSEEILPAIIVIRAGGGGDKELAGPIAAAIAQKGFVAVSIEYRTDSEAAFPAAIHDTKAAVRWLKANAETYHIDPDAIGAIGGSFGALLSVYSGVTRGIPELEGKGGYKESSSEIMAIVGFSTLTNLADFPDRIEKFIGEPYENNTSLWAFASPISHVSQNSPPLLLIASETDTTVPFQQSVIMSQAYEEAGAEVELMLLPDADHGFWYFEEWFEDTIARASVFFHRHLDVH